MINYLFATEKMGNKATNQQARCYCIFALEKTIELYPDPKESDKKISTDIENLEKIRNAGLNGLKNVKNLVPRISKQYAKIPREMAPESGFKFF